MEDETQKLMDSVLGHIHAMYKKMGDMADFLEKQHLASSKELRERNSGWHQFEPSEQEERDAERRQRECDELYDRAKTIRECMGIIAQEWKDIVGENITIQFSKWNMK